MTEKYVALYAAVWHIDYRDLGNSNKSGSDLDPHRQTKYYVKQLWFVPRQASYFFISSLCAKLANSMITVQIGESHLSSKYFIQQNVGPPLSQ